MNARKIIPSSAYPFLAITAVGTLLLLATGAFAVAATLSDFPTGLGGPLPPQDDAEPTPGQSATIGEDHETANFGWEYPNVLESPTSTPTATSVPATSSPTEERCLDRLDLVKDVTIPDDTPLAPGQSIEKIWRVRNIGTCTWTTGYAIVFAGGHRLSGPTARALPSAVVPGQTVDLRLRLAAPTTPGTYRGYWQLRNEHGKHFGMGEDGDLPFWVQIIASSAGQTVTGSWKGEYFSNRDLSGKPDLVRDDPVIDFDWRRSAPAPGVPDDDFSVRWTGKVALDTATYRFKAYVDDGVRLWIDGQLLIDEWVNGSARELTGLIRLPKGQHTARMEYYDQNADARARLSWEKVSDPLFADWKGEYFANIDLEGGPALVRNDKSIDFAWRSGGPGSGIPSDDFAARWTRSVSFDSGTYAFSLRADDGVRVWVDEKLIIDEWHPSSGTTTYTAERSLSGAVPVRIEYYEEGGKAEIELSWKQMAPTPTPTFTPTPTYTPTPSTTPTETPTATSTPTPTSTTTPTASSTPTPSASPSLTPTEGGPSPF